LSLIWGLAPQLGDPSTALRMTGWGAVSGRRTEELARDDGLEIK